MFFSFKKNIYKLGDYKLILPKKHMLPIFKKNFLLYDQFLPFLIKNINKRGEIIDVGANCGDTLLSIYIEKNTYLCIEPDPFFYSYLIENININKLKNVETYNIFVGNSGFVEGKLIGNNTSKKIELGGDLVVEYKKIDNLFEGKNNIFLLKSDVDGFDYDIIRSAEKIISEQQPILFFEAQFNVESDKNKYIELIEWCINFKYVYCVLFDNFGQVFYRGEINVELINNFFNYVYFQNFGKANRTIYYYDILLCNLHDKKLIDPIILDYIESYC